MPIYCYFICHDINIIIHFKKAQIHEGSSLALVLQILHQTLMLVGFEESGHVEPRPAWTLRFSFRVVFKTWQLCSGHRL